MRRPSCVLLRRLITLAAVSALFLVMVQPPAGAGSAIRPASDPTVPAEEEQRHAVVTGAVLVRVQARTRPHADPLESVAPNLPIVGRSLLQGLARKGAAHRGYAGAVPPLRC